MQAVCLIMSFISPSLSSAKRRSVRSNSGISRYSERLVKSCSGIFPATEYVSQNLLRVANAILSFGCTSMQRALTNVHTAWEASSLNASSETNGQSEWFIKYSAMSCMLRLLLTRIAILLQGTPLSTNLSTVSSVVCIILSSIFSPPRS